MQIREILTVVTGDGEVDYVYADEVEDNESTDVIDREIVHMPN